MTDSYYVADSGRTPTVKHSRPDCSHFRHGNTVVWPPRTATLKEATELRLCLDCSKNTR